MKAESQSQKIDELIADDKKRTEDRKVILQELLQEATDRKGFILVHQSAMGKTLTGSGNPRLVPSYAATHSLEWIANHVKLGSQMPFMENKIDPETGRLEIDEENAEEVKQRAPDWTRQPALAAYLAQSTRKFGPIIAVVSPPWVDDPKHENWSKGRALKSATEFQALDLEGRIGLLKLDGVLIYALDGQHRVIGIQGIRDVRDNPQGLVLRTVDGVATKVSYPKAEFLKMFNLSIEDLQSLLNETMIVEYLPAVIAGETREEASRRIRSTFISINSYAKKTDKGENILLDEMDGYAIVARKAGVFHKLFNARGDNNRVNWKNTSIPKKRTEWYTTLQTIREMADGYLAGVDADRAQRWETQFKGQMPVRPTEEDLDSAKQDFFQFLDQVYLLPVFQTLERGDVQNRAEDLQKWREFPSEAEPENHGHLLLRPIGQMILAKAVGILTKSREKGGKGMSLEDVFRKLKRLDDKKGFEAHLPETVWYGITYDKEADKMIMGNAKLAVDLLVYLVSGLDEPYRQQLWQEFVAARTVNKEQKLWVNLEGKLVEFDESNQELPSPV